MMEEHHPYMRLALEEARLAVTAGEVPVGAVIIREGEVLARAHNRRETDREPTAHAELLAIQEAARKLRAWRLEGTRLYVTLEPCLMCWGAIVLSRIPEVVFGAMDAKAGVCGSVLSLHEEDRFNHQPDVISGILGEECGGILSEFFQELREGKKLLANGGKSL